MEDMSLDRAENVIGVGQNYDMKHVLRCFEVVHWVKTENREIDDLPNVILAKNVIMRDLVVQQKKKYRIFDIESPFAKTCPKCKGSGEIYKFFKKTVKVNCHICGRSGKIMGECPKCKGTGRFVKRWKPPGGGVDVQCIKCEGKKQVLVSCDNCVGKGYVKKPVLTDKIKSTTPCSKCKQLGFIPKKHKLVSKKKKKQKKQSAIPFNPIKSKNGRSLADVIKQVSEASGEE